LAEKLAAYAAGLRYEDLDAATVERVKSHVIDTLGCGIAAFDERPVRVCREIAQPSLCRTITAASNISAIHWTSCSSTIGSSPIFSSLARLS
jgi:2-methylcitrate dehydratase PrpD